MVDVDIDAGKLANTNKTGCRDGQTDPMWLVVPVVEKLQQR